MNKEPRPQGRVPVQFVSDIKTGDFQMKQHCALTHLKFLIIGYSIFARWFLFKNDAFAPQEPKIVRRAGFG
ncbi:MAG: hypothetical protein HOO88_07495 [Kiritimatiellaceae bacterium]|nr:hypothetical protein [Kiritimatiellaceae bacterium]